jgi:hypothetical protein
MPLFKGLGQFWWLMAVSVFFATDYGRLLICPDAGEGES